MSLLKRISDVRLGLLGALAIVLVVAAALNVRSLPGIRPSARFTANFAEAGGLVEGNSVVLSGATVGRVDSIQLNGGHVEVDFSLDDDDLRLGSATSARIVTVTLLGEAALEVIPAGTGRLKGAIPISRTSSPYNITAALGDLATTSTQIDKGAVDEALTVTSEAFSQTPSSLRSALDGLGKLSEAVAVNDGALQQLLGRASRVSGVLASRNREVGTLLVSSQKLLAELNSRRDLVLDLLRQVSALSTQLHALINENDARVSPALKQLDQVVVLLNRNKRNLEKTIQGAHDYAVAFGEAISTGPFFDAYVQNLTSPASVAPVISGLVP
jgi:phospholipid/cholesterol/gamma-HCH transport system substrate-binding protein